LNRTFSQAEYIDILSWQDNPANQGLDIANFRIYWVSQFGIRTLLAVVSADQTEYSHRKAGQASLPYHVAAVTGSGREGEPAVITVR
jgi:hypothetical protein